MKILHTADLHLGMSNYSKLDPNSGLDSRLLDFFQTFNNIIETAIREKVDIFIFAGDAYKTRDPSPTQQRGFGEGIKKLTKVGIPVVLVVGNHDSPNAAGKANTLDIYSALEIDNVWVCRKVEFLNIPTKSGNLQVITVPWINQESLKTIGDKLSTFYGKITADNPAILAGHLEVEGASFGSEKGLVLTGDITVPLALLTERKLDYVALGHIHKHQVLLQNPLIIYSGSPERIDFGEEKEEKGFIIIDIENGKTTYKFIPSRPRKFLTIEIDLKANKENPTKTILDEIKKNEIDDAIVKVIINIPADLGQEIEMDKIKKALSSANFVAGISKNIERKDRVKLKDQKDVESLTPLEALRKYLESKKYSTEKIKNLEKYTVQILES